MFVCLASAALANPLPEGILFTQINSDSGPFYTECEASLQHTTMTGELGFEVALKCYIAEGQTGLEDFAASFTWPAEWEYLGCEVPYGYEGDIIVTGNQADVNVTYLGCPVVTTELAPLLRFNLNVTGPGTFSLTGGEAFFRICEPDVIEFNTYGGAVAYAGVVCGYCYESCDLEEMCIPRALEDEISTQVVFGEAGTLTVPFQMYQTMMPSCSPGLDMSESWMSGSVGQQGDIDYIVTLNIDTAGLAPGMYGGWVSLQEDCRACTWIDLEVLPLVAIERADWGAVKAKY